MKAAILSDIHGNLEALQAVMDDIVKQGVQYVYCLGDIISYGPDPVSCLRVAQTFNLSLLGNHEEAVIKNEDNFSPSASKAAAWTRKVLSLPNNKHFLSYLRTLPKKFETGNSLLVHGSPIDTQNQYLIPEQLYSPTHLIIFKVNFAHVKHVCFFGHTHRPGMFVLDDKTGSIFFLDPTYNDPMRIDSNDKYMINPGSVGQPRDKDPRACYLIVEKGHVLWRRIPYNNVQTKNKILTIPELDDYLGYRLLSGS